MVGGTEAGQGWYIRQRWGVTTRHRHRFHMEGYLSIIYWSVSVLLHIHMDIGETVGKRDLKVDGKRFGQ
jgi:hypothetical protein